MPVLKLQERCADVRERKGRGATGTSSFPSATSPAGVVTLFSCDPFAFDAAGDPFADCLVDAAPILERA
jgi:hypothetical protein